jgi:hypothetical protein
MNYRQRIRTGLIMLAFIIGFIGDTPRTGLSQAFIGDVPRTVPIS